MKTVQNEQQRITATLAKLKELAAVDYSSEATKFAASFKKLGADVESDQGEDSVQVTAVFEKSAGFELWVRNDRYVSFYTASGELIEFFTKQGYVTHWRGAPRASRGLLMWSGKKGDVELGLYAFAGKADPKKTDQGLVVAVFSKAVFGKKTS